MPLGPGDLGAAPERRMSLGSRAPAPWVGEERVRDRVGAARERALLFAHGWACLYARGRALCGPPGARGRRRARSRPGYLFLELWPGAGAAFWGARSPANPGFRARALLLGGGASTRARRTPLLCGEAERRRAGGWQCEEGCGLDPSCSGDAPDRLGETNRLCGLASGPAPLQSGRDCSISKNAVTQGPCAGWVLGENAALLLKPTPVGL